MARSVGSVEVTVDANTGKLKAQIVKASEEAGSAGARRLSDELGDIDTTEALNKVRALAKRIEATLEAIDDADIGIDTTRLQADLNRAKQQIAALDDTVDLGAEIDLSEVRTEILEFYRRQEAQELEIELEPLLKGITADIATWRRRETEDEVDITLSAEVAAASAALDAWRTEQGEDEVDIRVEADLADATAFVEAWRATEEANALNLPVTPELLEAEEKIAALTGQKLELQLDIAVREAKAQRDIDAFLEKNKLRDVDFEVALHTAAADADMEDWFARVEALEADIELQLHTLTATMQANAFKDLTEAERIAVQLQLDIDWLEVLRTRARLEATFDEINVPIEPEFDPTATAMAKVETDLATWATDAGDSAGGDSGNAFGSAFKGGALSSLGDQGFWIGIGLTLAEPLAAGMEGVISAGTAVISSGISAISGAVGGATPVLFAGGAAFAAVALGIGGVGDALKDVKAENWEALEKKMKDLTPAAQDFVRAFAEVQPTIQAVRDEVQQELFEGLGDELRDLSEETIPDVGDALVIAAGSVNEFIGQLADVAKETDFKETMEAIDPALDNAFDAASNLAGTLAPFLMAAAPAAETLTGWLEDGAAALKDWVIEHPEDINDFLSGGVESLMKWSSLLFSIGDLLATVFQGGVDEGDKFVEKLDAIVTRWDQWLEGPEGQNALEDFFQKGEQAMRDVKPLLDGLSEAWGILTEEGAGEKFADLMTEAGEAAPAFAEFLQALGEMELGTAILNIIDTLGLIGEIFSLLPDDVEKFIGQLLVVTKVLGPLNRALSAMGKSFGWLALLNIAVTAGVAIFDALTNGADTAALSTEHVGDAWANLNQQLLEGEAVASTTASMWGNLAEALPEIENFDRLVTAMEKLGITATDFVKQIEPLREGGDAAVEAMMKLGKEAPVTEEALRSVAEMVDGTNENIGSMAGALDIAVGSLAQSGRFVDPAIDSFEELSAATDMPIESLLLMGGVSDDYAEDMAQIAEATGEPIQDLWSVARNLEQLQDSAEDVDLSKIAEEELRLAAVSNDATQGILDQARANLLAKGGFDNMDDSIANILAKGEDLVPLYEEYVNVSNEMARAQDDTATSTDASIEATRGMAGVIEEVTAASNERIAALEAERAAAFDAWNEEQKLGERVAHTASIVAARDFGIPEEFAESVNLLGQAWERASAAADSFNSVMEVMRGGLPDLEEATAAVEQGWDDMAEGITETVSTAEGSVEKTLIPTVKVMEDSFGRVFSVFDQGEEAGRQYSEMVRGQADDILAWGAANIQAGQDADDVIASMEGMRTSMEAQLVQWGVGAQAASDYVDTLLGTPEVLETVYRTPGLLEALLNAEDLTVLYDSAGEPVITEFENLGIDISEEEARELHDLIMGLDNVVATPEVGLDGVPGTTDDIATVEGDLATVDETTAEPNVQLAGHVVMIALLAIEQELLNTLNETVADPTLQLTDYNTVTGQIATLSTGVANLGLMIAAPDARLDNYSTVKEQIATLAIAVANLSFMVASPDVRLDNYSTVMSQIDNIQANIDSLHGRTITITTQHVTTGAPAMAGTIVTSPQTRLVGEHGYAEAIVPLDLPLNRVNPEVRELAAMIRSNALPSLGPARPQRGGANINQYFTLPSADPGAVATQVLNRAAAMAAS